MGTAARITTIVVVATVVAFGDVLAQSFAGPKTHRAPRQHSRPQRPPPSHAPGMAFGDPLPGLTKAQRAAFAVGEDAFEEEDDQASGLGPIFNYVSCVACHSVPDTGGGSEILETRFGKTVNGHFDPMTDRSGSLLQQMAIAPKAQETVPRDANVVAQRQTTPLFGLGLIEAIDDRTIVSNALAQKPDGVSGRVAMEECAFARRCCTMAARQRSTRRSGSTTAKGRSPAIVTCAWVRRCRTS